MKITTQKGEQSCKCTELSLKRKEGIREIKQRTHPKTHTKKQNETIKNKQTHSSTFYYGSHNFGTKIIESATNQTLL